MKRKYLLLLLIASLSLGFWGGWEFRDFMAIDGCLDHGGSWSDGGYCRFQ